MCPDIDVLVESVASPFHLLRFFFIKKFLVKNNGFIYKINYVNLNNTSLHVYPLCSFFCCMQRGKCFIYFCFLSKFGKSENSYRPYGNKSPIYNFIENRLISMFWIEFCVSFVYQIPSCLTNRNSLHLLISLMQMKIIK